MNPPSHPLVQFPPLWLEFLGPSSLSSPFLGSSYVLSPQAASPVGGPLPLPGVWPPTSPAFWQALLQGSSCDSAQGAQPLDLPSSKCTHWGQSPTGAVLLGGEGSCPQCWKLAALKAPRGWGSGETVRGVEVWAPLSTVHSSESRGALTQPCLQFRHVASLDTGEKIPNGVTFQEPNTAEVWAESRANSP